MLLHEFIARTGYTPKSAAEYSKIESEYYNYPGDKDAFCKMWNLARYTPTFPFMLAELKSHKCVLVLERDVNRFIQYAYLNGIGVCGGAFCGDARWLYID